MNSKEDLGKESIPVDRDQFVQLSKEKIALIKRELVGFTQWQASHILQCVQEELNEQKEGVLDNLIVGS